MKRKTIKEQVQALVNLWNSKECKYCNSSYPYNKPYFLDVNGTLCSISDEPGKLSHAADIFSWSCEKEKYKHRRPIGEVEAKAYIRIWGRDEE